MSTQKDIAEVTGYSLSVVSRALRDLPDSEVAEATRAAIRAAARRLGYAPNRAASLLTRGGTPALGFFLPNYATEVVLELSTGLAELSNEQGFSYNFYYEISDMSLTAFMERHRTCRNIGIASYLPPALEAQRKVVQVWQELRRQGTSVTAMNAPASVIGDIPKVSIDNRLAGRLVAERFLATGCARFVSNLYHIDGQMRDRALGFRECLAEHGVTAEVWDWAMWPEWPDFEERRRAMVDDLMRGPFPVGVQALADSHALVFYPELHRRGLLGELGKRIRLVGYSDTMAGQLAIPPLTTVALPFRALGRLAAASLLNQILHLNLPMDFSRLKPHLVIRETA
jgi:DNA-binding LacI/PurR family transcriptional regulator